MARSRKEDLVRSLAEQNEARRRVQESVGWLERRADPESSGGELHDLLAGLRADLEVERDWFAKQSDVAAWPPRLVPLLVRTIDGLRRAADLARTGKEMRPECH